jgi:hypothetical protein
VKQATSLGVYAWVVVGLLAACGWSSTPVATAAKAAVQATDLPKGFQKCAGSGDMDSFLQAIKSTDSNTYRKMNSDWTVARKDGAVAAEVILASDSAAGCDAAHNQASRDIGSLDAPLVLNVVFQFKDEIGAVKGYARDSISSLRVADFHELGDTAVYGKRTGLGRNSVAAMVASLYVAIWQSSQFLLALTTVHVDPGAGKKIATSENDRIAKFNGGSPAQAPDASAFIPKPVSVSGIVGRPMVLSDATVTVASANLDAPTPDGHAQLPAGDRLVSIDIEAAYTRSGPRFDWELSDSSGFKYDPAFSEEWQTQLQLVAGDTARAQVYFDVPRIATGLKLKVTVGDDTASVLLS